MPPTIASTINIPNKYICMKITSYPHILPQIGGGGKDNILNNILSAEADRVNHPAHYTSGKVECIDAIAAATQELQGIEAVCTANAIKYLWR